MIHIDFPLRQSSSALAFVEFSFEQWKLTLGELAVCSVKNGFLSAQIAADVQGKNHVCQFFGIGRAAEL